MISLNETMIMPINGITSAIVIVLMIRGYKKGLARSVLSFAGTALAFYFAWLLSGPLGRQLALYHSELNDFATALFYGITSVFINRILWFLISFLILRFVVFLIDKALKGIHKIPVVHAIGGLLGAVFGAVEAVIWLLVLCVLLETPLFSNGSLIIRESALGIIRDKTAEVFTTFASPVIGSDMFNEMKTNVEEISEEQADAFEQWLIENDFQIGEEE